jgi:hypothetical protein
MVREPSFSSADMHLGIMGRQQVGDALGPFNKAVIARVKIFLVTHIQSLGLGFKAIKVKVVNGAALTSIFVNDRERGDCW